MGSISDARSGFRRLFWSCVLVAALSVYLFQLHEMVLKYLAHPVKTTTTIDYKIPMDFPAVTVCNLNPIKGTILRSKSFQKKIQDSSSLVRRVKRQNKDSFESTNNPEYDNPEFDEFPSSTVKATSVEVDYELRTSTAMPTTTESDYELPTSTAMPTTTESGVGPPTSTTRNSRKSGVQVENEYEAFNDLVKIVNTNATEYVESSDWLKRATPAMRHDAVVQGEFMYLINSIDKEVRKQLAYDLEDLLIDCSFNGRNCIPGDFLPLDNPKYGRCFVFNVGRNSSKHRVPVRQVNSSGADVSLELTLFVDQNNYVTEATREAGYKVVIHHPSKPPIPEKDGYMVGPGHFTALSVALSEYERAPRPYGECKNFTEADNRAMNMFLTQLPMTKPTLSSCMKTCEQLEIIKTCKCYSLLHGFDQAPAFDSVRDRQEYLPACHMSRDSDNFVCLTDVMQRVAAGYIPCKTKFCKDKECRHAVFQTSSSSAAWPAEMMFDRFRAVIERHPNPSIRGLLNVSRVDKKSFVEEKLFFASNFLKVKVFFEDLTIVRLKTESSYGIHELLSEVGGQGGLWLGVSVITLFEVLELLGDLLCVCLCRKPHSSPSKIEMT